jgi:hypothetical protein
MTGSAFEDFSSAINCNDFDIKIRSKFQAKTSKIYQESILNDQNQVEGAAERVWKGKLAGDALCYPTGNGFLNAFVIFLPTASIQVFLSV